MNRTFRCLLTVFAIPFLIGLCVPCTAQQTLNDGDWFERPLGEGVVWRYYLFEDLYGARQSISYVEVDLTRTDISIDFPYRADARERISSMIPSQIPDAVAGINGTYFNTSTGGHVTYLRVDGNEIPDAGGAWAPWSDGGGIALNLEGDPSIIERPTNGWSADLSYPDILACGPLVLIQNTVPAEDLSNMGSHCSSRHPRSAVGVTDDNRLILLTADGRTEMAAGMTCEEVGETMKQLGCVDALNLDGGGSTTLWAAGEMNSGVINFPSDNGQYDHVGERSCSNGISVSALPAGPLALDARLVSKVFEGSVESTSSQTVSLIYENIGTTTWTADDTHLVLSRPENRVSIFYDSETWLSPTEPVSMSPANVAPGEQATFSFQMVAPDVSTTTVYNEHFMLTSDGHGRFGPADSAAWMKFIVQPPLVPGEAFIVETRPGGQNIGWYSDSGMGNANVDTTAPGTTSGIGARYGSTYRSVAGYKEAVVAPDFPAAGYYNISVAWGAGSNRRSPITYHVDHIGGRSSFQLDQSELANVWIELGDEPFYFREGESGTVAMTNENIDVSGSMFANAFRFQYVEFPEPDKEYTVRHLNEIDTAPSIDGEISPGEWDGASNPASDFRMHNSISTGDTAGTSFRMLYDDESLYILVEFENPYLPGYASPPSPTTFESLAGDKVNFYLTPEGVSSEPFYRILLSPNRTDGKCHIWSQANLSKTTDANTGTGWFAGGDAAYGTNETRMTIEYRIDWDNFNESGMSLSGAPEDGTIWGLQVGLSNEVSGLDWEYVNWEPDATPGYINGNPFGALRFIRQETAQGAAFLIH